MSASSSTSKRQPGHVAGPACFIGALSILLVAGLEWLGVLMQIQKSLGDLVMGANGDGYAHQLPVWVVWGATAIFAFGLSLAMLASPRQWRRVLLWGVALALVAAWAPVLSLASYAPAVVAPWIAVLWSGVCALVYASNHVMDGDADEEGSA